MMTVLPALKIQYFQERMGLGHDDAVSQVASFDSVATSLSNVGNILCMPIIGRIADSAGRKWVLVAMVVSGAIPYSLLYLTHNPFFWYAGNILVFFYPSGVLTVLSMCVVDITDRGGSLEAMAWLFSSTGFAFMAPSALMIAFGTLNPDQLLLVAIAMAMVSSAIAMSMRETLPADTRSPLRRRVSSRESAGGVSKDSAHLDEIADNCVGPLALLRDDALVQTLAFIQVLQSLPESGVREIMLLYFTSDMAFQRVQQTLLVSFAGVTMVLTQTLGISGLVRCGVTPLKIVALGTLFNCSHMFLFAFSATLPLPAARAVCVGAVPIMSASMIAGPAVQAIVSAHVPAHRRGFVLGTLASCVSGTGVLGPFLLGQAFAHFSHATPFFLAGLVAAGAMWLTTCVLPGVLAEREAREREAALEREEATSNSDSMRVPLMKAGA